MASRAASTDPGFLQQLPDRRWWLVGAAFALGWLLFALVWLADRRDAPPEAVPVKAAAAPEAFQPLPRPMAAGDRIAPLPDPAGDAPRLVEQEPPPAPVAPAVDTPPLPPSIEDTTATATTAAAMVQAPAPLADQSPSPSYPAAAMRRRESGTVVVEVEVDAAGLPVSVEIDRRSGSRDLDRAAAEAVSNWRFQPARDATGNAVPGRLSIPIDFKLE